MSRSSLRSPTLLSSYYRPPQFATTAMPTSSTYRRTTNISTGRPLPTGPGPIFTSDISTRLRQNRTSDLPPVSRPIRGNHTTTYGSSYLPKTHTTKTDYSPTRLLSSSRRSQSYDNIPSSLAGLTIGTSQTETKTRSRRLSSESLGAVDSTTSKYTSSQSPVDTKTRASIYSPIERRSSLTNYDTRLRRDSLTSYSNSRVINEKSSTSNTKNSARENGGLTGLKNLGNTCFMNSITQCLSNCKPLLEYCLNDDYHLDINTTTSSMKGALFKAYANLMNDIWTMSSSSTSPNTFKSKVTRYAPRFSGYGQHDSQEFLRYALEGLHEDVNRVTEKVKPEIADDATEDRMKDADKSQLHWKRYLRLGNSKIIDLFVGQLKSTLRCTECGYCSTTFDPFWDLSLPIPKRASKVQLNECFRLFTQEETLDGDEKPTCAKCKTRRKCLKSFSIQKFPKILVLHLKRFSQDRYRGKIATLVDYPINDLDLGPFSADSGSRSVRYELFGVSNHSGTTYSGHYTAYCKHPYTGVWHEYNDARVNSISPRDIITSEGYVLFYQLLTH